MNNILRLDDLLATGGSLTAAINLIHKAGGVIHDVFILVELLDLGGRNCIADLYTQTSNVRGFLLNFVT